MESDADVEGQQDNQNDEDVEDEKMMEELQRLVDECTEPQDDDMLHGPPTDDG